MRKIIQTFLGIALIILSGATAAISQETTNAPKENTASSFQTTPLADDECAKLLEKSVETVKSLKSLTANLETEIAERKKLQTISDEEIKALRQTVESLNHLVAEQQKLIEILMKQSKTKIKVCIIC